MIFKISWAADPSRSGTVWFRSGMVPSCHINYQKFGEFMFGKIITKKLILTSNFSSVLFRGIPSHKESPNFWHVISQLRTTLYCNHIVHDREGSAAHEILNHCISPTLSSKLKRLNFKWILYKSKICIRYYQSYALELCITMQSVETICNRNGGHTFCLKSSKVQKLHFSKS